MYIHIYLLIYIDHCKRPFRKFSIRFQHGKCEFWIYSIAISWISIDIKEKNPNSIFHISIFEFNSSLRLLMVSVFDYNPGSRWNRTEFPSGSKMFSIARVFTLVFNIFKPALTLHEIELGFSNLVRKSKH